MSPSSWEEVQALVRLETLRAGERRLRSRHADEFASFLDARRRYGALLDEAARAEAAQRIHEQTWRPRQTIPLVLSGPPATAHRDAAVILEDARAWKARADEREVRAASLLDSCNDLKKSADVLEAILKEARQPLPAPNGLLLPPRKTRR